jgi:hypothetical protein
MRLENLLNNGRKTTVFDNVPNDKKQHFIAGFIIGAIATLLFTTVISIVLGTAAAIAKELYDAVCNLITDFQNKPRTHTVDIFDVAYTIGGNVFATVFVCIVKLLFRV